MGVLLALFINSLKHPARVIGKREETASTQQRIKTNSNCFDGWYAIVCRSIGDECNCF